MIKEKYGEEVEKRIIEIGEDKKKWEKVIIDEQEKEWEIIIEGK